MKKLCKSCRRMLEPEGFYSYKLKTGRTYLATLCRPCHNERGNRQRKHSRDEFSVNKRGKCCAECGWDKDWRLLQADHIDPSEKLADVSTLAGQGSSRRAAREFMKCRLLCPNCHAANTQRQREAGMFRTPRKEREEEAPDDPQLDLFGVPGPKRRRDGDAN